MCLQDMVKDILTFLGVDYRVAPHIKLYFVVQGISYQKSDQSDNYFPYKKLLLKKLKIKMFKVDILTFW